MDEYGPQTKEIKGFLDEAKRLNLEQAEKLSVIWNSSLDSARIAVRTETWSAVLDASRKAVWDDSWDAVRTVLQTAIRSAVWDAVLNATWDAVWDAASDAVLNAVWDAAWDAALALVVKDKISEEHFNTLYAPWKFVMEK